MPFLAFRIFLVAAILTMLLERGCISKIFPVNITASYSIGCKLAEKYKFVNLWERCTFDLIPNLSHLKHSTVRRS